MTKELRELQLIWSTMFQTLKGHSSAVTHIIVNSEKGEIISAAQDKVRLNLLNFCP